MRITLVHRVHLCLKRSAVIFHPGRKVAAVVFVRGLIARGSRGTSTLGESCTVFVAPLMVKQQTNHLMRA